MDFNEFRSKISNLKNLELPGVEAQNKLAPILRIEEMKNLDFSTRKQNRAGVMAVFYPDKDDLAHLVLILRKTYRGVHSNQVGFPGGRVEPEDRDLEETALRETEEEVGISIRDIKVLKELTRLYIPPSDFWVHPFVGIMNKTPVLVPQENEVELILEVAVEELMDEQSLIKLKLDTSYATDIEVPAFSLAGHAVWGATAMMLSELKELLKKVL